MSDYSEFNSQYEQKTDTAYKNKKQNKIEGVSIRTAKTNFKTKIYHNKTSTFGVEVGYVCVCVYVCMCVCVYVCVLGWVGLSFHTAI